GIRKQELHDACEYLGIDYQMLGYRDKAMEFENQAKMAEHIKSILEEINPSVVVTHYPGHGVHPDHNAQGAATIEAVRLMDEDKRPEVWAAAITHNFVEVLGEPDVVIDATNNFDFKLNAILKHRSQAEAMLKRMESEEEMDSEFIKELKRKEPIMKKLYRSVDDRMLAGVCGGLGEYFNIDSTIIRLAVVVAGLFSLGVILFVYIVAALIIPNRIDVR